MTEMEWLSERYRLAGEMLKSTIEVWRIADPAGKRISRVLSDLIAATSNSPDVCIRLIAAAKSLRSRLLTDPIPWAFGGEYIRKVADDSLREAQGLRRAVDHDTLIILDNLVEAIDALTHVDPAVGPLLPQAIEEAACECVVVAANEGSATRIADWLQIEHTKVLTARELVHQRDEIEQVYVVGPPRLFPSAIVTTPVTSQMAFLVPEWFQNWSLPESPLKYAQGAYRVEVRPFLVPPSLSLTQEESVESPAEEDAMVPGPPWTPRSDPDRPPRNSEVLARRVLLSGSYCVFLDAGERIRAIDPTQPPEERLTSLPIEAVKPGVYLLLRKGENEQGVLLKEALDAFGPKQAEAIAASQRIWKMALSERICEYGMDRVEKELRGLGVGAADRTPTWVDPFLVRPQRNSDFQLLLKWLSVDEEPAFSLATDLLRERQHLGHARRLALEQRLGASDMTPLMRYGHLEVTAVDSQYRGMIASRVLAISRWQEIVPVQQVRVLFDDQEGDGRWLE